MMKFLTFLGSGLILAASVTLAQPPGSSMSIAPGKQGWAHQASDLPADPNVHFGVLANGMRFAILKNATPPGEASLRLRIDAGSLQERDEQRGIAHFLEHMVLNGTKHVPEGEFAPRLERAGLKFGADTNASTDFEQTLYKLDLPETDAETIDTALFLLREIADEAILSTPAITRERGIILSEERKRATPQYQLFVDELRYLLKDDRLPRRLPIGDTAIIGHAPRELFVEFYNAHYRPERATLIAVGDFDVAQLEAKIRKGFATWRGEGPPPSEIEPAALPARPTEARIFSTPGIATQISLNWVRAADTRPDTRANRRERLIDRLAMQIIDRRLERLAGKTNKPPFIAASISRQEYADRAESIQIQAVAQPGRWRAALVAIEQERRRVAAYGFTQAELEREIVETRAQLGNAAAGAATRQSPRLAQMLAATVNAHQVFTTPATHLALFEETVRGLTADKLGAAITRLLGEGEPLLYLSAPAPVPNGDQALLFAYRASQRLALGKAPRIPEVKAWPYSDFGAAGSIAERHEIEDLGATAVRFQNGVRLTVKPTKFKDDEVLVSVRFGDGQLALPPDRTSPAWALTSGGFVSGGLAKLNFEQIEEVLASKVYGASLALDEDRFLLTGRTRPEDIAIQMQVLAAYMTQPGWRPAAWNRLRAFSGTLHDRMASTPSGIFNRDADMLLHSGDPRWAVPDRAEMAAFSMDDGRRLLKPALDSGLIEVVIVGNIGVDEAIRQTALTFGALPVRTGQAVLPSARAVHFPMAGLERRTHKGRVDQGLAFIAWPTSDFYSDQRRSRALNLLAQVMQIRLREEIREKQGATYSPNASHSPSETYSGYGYIAARIEAPPAGLDGFFRDALAIAGSLRDKPVTDDELQRARKPLIENIYRQRAGNQWWLDRLGAIDRPEVLASIRGSIGQYESLTRADVQRVAKEFLDERRAWRMIVTPEEGTP